MRGVGSRRVRVIPGDVLLVGGYEVSAEVLIEMLAPDKRLLWAVVRNGEHDIQPVPYDESRVVWLTDEDLIRADADVV